MLKRVQFSGIKSLLDVTLDLEPLTVLVGPNGCGKSTVLNQIETLCGLTQPPENRNGVLTQVTRELGDREPQGLYTHGWSGGLMWEGGDTQDRHFRLEINRSAENWLHRMTITADDGGARHVIKHDTKADREQAAMATLRSLVWEAQRLRLVPHLIAESSDVGVEALDPSGAGLPTILKDLAGNDIRAFEAIQVDLRRIVPHFEHLRFGKSKFVEADDRGRQVEKSVNTLELVFRGGVRLPAAEASDGTLLALALLTAAHDPDLPNLVLMDDIDHGLHLSAQYTMIDAIRAVMKVRPELQVICTSHAPVLLDSFTPQEVRVLALDKEGHTRAKPLTAHPDYERWATALRTGELWANLGEDWVLDG